MDWKRLEVISILLFALLAPGQAPAAAANPADAELILPSETCRGVFIVPVSFGKGNGTTLDLLVDTGSSWTLLDPGAIRSLVGGGGRVGKVLFQGGRIGPHELGPIRVYALPMRQLGLAFGRDIDGIIGFPDS